AGGRGLGGGGVRGTRSGRASRKRSETSWKHCLTGKRSCNCFAMSGSRSQTATISHPGMRRICATCASAILPHPTMATLSMLASAPAPFKIEPQRFRHGHARFPADQPLHFLVAVAGPLPIRVPAPAIECRRQLFVRPNRVFLPGVTKQITQSMRNIKRPKSPHLTLVKTQKCAARRQVVIDDVEHLAVDSLSH